MNPALQQTSSVDVVVVGAGQAGLSAAYHLLRLGFEPWREVVVLDANPRPGGAWQHRWDTLSMTDVHGIFQLPDMQLPPIEGHERANDVVPDYFAAYEQRLGLPVARPVSASRVESRADGRLEVVSAGSSRWTTRALVNATGTWDRPFLPRYPGMELFTGRQLHTVDYRGPDEFAGQHVVVVGGGASAVQLLAELSDVATTTWVTRRPPLWRTKPLGPAEGREAVARVEERVRQGLPPHSVVDVTGLHLRPQEQAAAEKGVYRRQPMFERVVADGVVWSDGEFEQADAIIWATGFRAALSHLAPLHLREPNGGIRMDGTRTARDSRVHLLGYGPTASTVGANRAGRSAARELRDWLQPLAA